METVSDFIFLGSKISVDGDCSHEIKRRLLLGRNVMTNLDSVLKSRDITLLTKVHLAKAMVLLVVTYGCEIWTIIKAECQRLDAFELWCWRRLLRVPWTERRSNQWILKKISPDLNIHWKDWCWSSNTLATWCEELTHWKGPDAGKDWRQEKGMTEVEIFGCHHQLDGHEFAQDPGVGNRQGCLVCCSPRGRKESDMTEQLSWNKVFPGLRQWASD